MKFGSLLPFIMLLFLVTGISLLLFIKTLCPINQFPPWASNILCSNKPFFLSPHSTVKRSLFSMEQTIPSKKLEIVDGNIESSVVDLPDQVLDCILERLSPTELCTTAGVCCSFRERCNHLLGRNLKHKWGRVLGPPAYNEWQCFIASSRKFGAPYGFPTQGLIRLIWQVWPFSQLRSQLDHSNTEKQSWLPVVDSALSLYLALESGKFWFPAQVYNRENGHVGFLMSCYDAQLRYDSQTDTFQARYPPHGRKAVAIETLIDWERVRSPPIDTPPHQLHISDCLNDLRPGDHIEIQWKRNKEFPYGWWYGVVGHLKLCDRDRNCCQCHNSDIVVLEFKQFSPGSRWRCTTINRKDHREEHNEVDGFCGGIRKLQNHDEIATWKRLWPKDMLE